jgi:hypothetical protein
MLTTRLQIQAIADHLAGLTQPDLPPSHFSPPWHAIYQALLAAPPDASHQALLQALADRADRDTLIDLIFAAVPGERLDFPSLHQVAPTLPPIRWLWPAWIPRGLLSLLGSVPGGGKSYLALDLARRIIGDLPFPDGAPVPTPGANVIYVDAEDVPQVTKQRAEAWDMDTTCLYLMTPQQRPYIDFSRPPDRDRLAEMAYRLQPALVVVDSLSTISSKGENNVEDVREVLSFLNKLAQDFQCALLLVHHLRKRGLPAFTDPLTVDDFRGSTHIIAIARSVLGLSVIQTGPEPDRNGPRRLEIVKTNLGCYPPPLGVEFLPQHPAGALLQYGPPPQPYRAPTRLELCQTWLLDTLRQEGAPLAPADLLELAREAGYSRTTFYDARAALGDQIRDTKGRRRRGNKWELAQ